MSLRTDKAGLLYLFLIGVSSVFVVVCFVFSLCAVLWPPGCVLMDLNTTTQDNGIVGLPAAPSLSN